MTYDKVGSIANQHQFGPGQLEDDHTRQYRISSRDRNPYAPVPGIDYFGESMSGDLILLVRVKRHTKVKMQEMLRSSIRRKELMFPQMPNERLVRKDEFAAAKPFINRLRAKNDPSPKFIAPPIKFKGARRQQCVENSVAYCAENPEYEPVKGFKLWILPMPTPEPYVALVHVVVRHKKSGKYIDVTPADKGDERQEMLFIPSSRIYSDWKAHEIADYCKKNLEIRMGSVCTGMTLLFRQHTTGDRLNKATPEELKLLMCPKVSSMQAHLFGLPSAVIQMFLEHTGANFIETGGKTYCMVDASEYRRLYQCTKETLEKQGMDAFGHPSKQEEEESRVGKTTAAVVTAAVATAAVATAAFLAG